MIKVPRLAKGHGYKGPEFFGCFNTGMAPAIFHSITGKYVVGPEIPCRDAMRQGDTLLGRRTVGEGRRKVCIFAGRKPAVVKFMVLCGAQIMENYGVRQDYLATRHKAAQGDLAAALAFGDF